MGFCKQSAQGRVCSGKEEIHGVLAIPRSYLESNWSAVGGTWMSKTQIVATLQRAVIFFTFFEPFLCQRSLRSGAIRPTS